MAKKKKIKVDTKTIQAQSRNKYMQQMKVVYDQIHPGLFSLFTQEQRNILYLMRGTVIRTRSEENAPGWLLQCFDDFIRDQMKKDEIEIFPGKLKLSLLDYSNYIFPLEVWSMEMKEHEGKEWYDEFMATKEDRITRYANLMDAIAIVLMYHASNQQRTMYNLEYKMSQDHGSTGEKIRVIQQFLLKRYNPREFLMIFEDRKKKPRTVLEVVYNNHTAFKNEGYEILTPFKMLPSKLGVKVSGEEKPIPVVILRHALRRLEERLGCPVAGYSEAYIVPSLLKGNVCYTPNGSILVEYYMREKKAGYLQVDVDKDGILIRTFLFLTNASTPEGEKLRKHIGLKKDDVKFLNIDRLMPLMDSDVLQDEELCKIIRDAGCESLIELCEELKDTECWNRTEEKKQLAEKMKKYMQLENTEEEEEYIPIDE
jgi:hypothetical protein